MTGSRDLVNHKNGRGIKWIPEMKKSVLKVATWSSLRPLELKSELLLEFEFLKKNTKICMEKCYWIASLAHQQYFPHKSFKFPKNSNCH